jgi:hypothetical protein
MKQIHTKFLSRKEAEGITTAYNAGIMYSSEVPYDKKIAIISVVSPAEPGEDPASLVTKLDGFWYKVLRLQFHDIDPSHCSPERIAQHKPMTEEHARQIIAFLLEVENDADEIWVHCEAGISRSAAVAKFIATVYGSFFPESYSLYNKHVFSILRRVYGLASLQGEPVPGLKEDFV